jgi:hypothetical protein
MRTKTEKAITNRSNRLTTIRVNTNTEPQRWDGAMGFDGEGESCMSPHSTRSRDL